MMSVDDKLIRFYNCYLLRDHSLVLDDFWIKNGIILDSKELFYGEKVCPDLSIDCEGDIISPGLIDLQINGGFGIDFSTDIRDAKSAISCLSKVTTQLYRFGVTSYCPTVVTSPESSYKEIVPFINREGSILGLHLEGPFISSVKKGAHPPQYIQSLSSFDDILNVYGNNLESVRIITLAPEILPPDNLFDLIKKLTQKGIVVSLGHSVSDISTAEKAVDAGASMVTHLFNAMSAFHHRSDPGLIGLLTYPRDKKKIFFGLISDGIHSNNAALRLAYKTNFEGLCLVTDAIGALGLSNGQYKLGQLDIEVRGNRALVKDTKDTLCGAMTDLLQAVSIFRKGSRCSEVEALEAVTLHPAQALGIEYQKGTLDYGTDADFIILRRNERKNGYYDLMSTWVKGVKVYSNSGKC
ncbi:N-acetylglucosamine-6-phosphate deacetylase [Lepeophtheirus salmonis]|uniref:N-acetylglucosamine-6-phosphate deacetylase n=1 Tax=Lepeophtheirus salmonis TaxID=72036 RepID=A0A0K2T0P9_LEPSM|nr:N-acetylglucosamine-6-phosphate deacetylase-like [Lepeophtheirus salmonis]XP_040575115.1 N-acetylglucosamine-6-phosphate deacetylase-like [Lepeophtheirus salmonis]